MSAWYKVQRALLNISHIHDWFNNVDTLNCPKPFETFETMHVPNYLTATLIISSL